MPQQNSLALLCASQGFFLIEIKKECYAAHSFFCRSNAKKKS